MASETLGEKILREAIEREEAWAAGLLREEYKVMRKFRRGWVIQSQEERRLVGRLVDSRFMICEEYKLESGSPWEIAELTPEGRRIMIRRRWLKNPLLRPFYRVRVFLLNRQVKKY